MTIYNKNKTVILENPDLSMGYLMNDTLIKIIPEIHAIPPITELRVVKEYPNGGKDIEEIIEKEGIEYQPEKEEIEEIQIYIPFTQTELLNIKVNEIKQQLAATDYKALKFAEGLISEIEYAPIKQERQNLRQQINQLENESNNI